MRRLLLVDDSKTTLEAARAALEPYGLVVAHAENGASALASLRGLAFDLVLLELELPVLDGASLLRHMRAQGIATPVVLVTASGAAQAVSAARELGAGDHVGKPFSPEALRAAVVRAVGLDPSQLQAAGARLLLQHPDPALAARLRLHLPPHVELASAATAQQAFELARRGRFDVVLLDGRGPASAVERAAEAFGAAQPEAVIFALAPGAPPEARWSERGALHGTLPDSFGSELVRGFLYLNFLRPLVFAEGAALRAAGFEGNERNQPAYFASLCRALRRRAPLPRAQECSVDLTRVPPFPGKVAALIEEVLTRFEAAGPAPTVRVAPALLERLAARPELRRVALHG